MTAMPATVSGVIGSRKSNQAMTAVVGGTRYIRLVTLAAGLALGVLLGWFVKRHR